MPRDFIILLYIRTYAINFVRVFRRFSASFQELIQYERVSGLTLSRGLYVVYVELVSSLDDIYLIVPSSLVNVLPYVKVSDNQILDRYVDIDY